MKPGEAELYRVYQDRVYQDPLSCMKGAMSAAAQPECGSSIEPKVSHLTTRKTWYLDGLEKFIAGQNRNRPAKKDYCIFPRRIPKLQKGSLLTAKSLKEILLSSNPSDTLSAAKKNHSPFFRRV